MLAVMSCGPVDTDNPSTADLLFRYDDLNAYLASRRVELNGLQARLSQLDDELLSRTAEVRIVQKDVRSMRSANESEAALAKEAAEELEAYRDQLASRYGRLIDAETELAQLQSRVVSNSNQAKADQAEIEVLKAEIADLEAQVEALDRVIARTLDDRRRTLLRQRS